jgi:CubicO group peptidase (beta-lactamase class C family)
MEDLQARLESIRAKYGIPSLSAGLYDGLKRTVAATGVRKLGEDAPVQRDDSFHMNSCGKAVTADIIHQLAAEQRLSLSDNMAALFPELPVHADFQQVTIRDLLLHRSGIGRDAGSITEARNSTYGQYAYSNIGYILLGMIAERATGSTYKELVQERVFRPLGMHHSRIILPDGEPLPHAIAWGHMADEAGGFTPSIEDTSAIYVAAGMIHASAGDWLVFMEHLLRQPHIGEAATQGQEKAYTASAFVFKDGSLWHSGRSGLYYAEHRLLPDRQAAYVITAGAATPEAIQAVQEVGECLQRHLAGAEHTPDTSPKSDNLLARLARFINRLGGHQQGEQQAR